MAQPSSDFPFQDLAADDTETTSFDPESRPEGWTEEDEQQSIDDAHESMADAPEWTPPSWWTAEDHERWRIQCEAMEGLDA
jgi:hypothetical protein